MTQGKTQKEALEMIKDAVLVLLKDSYNNELLGKRFQLTVNLHKDEVFSIKASDDKLLFSLGMTRNGERHAP